MNSYFIGLYLWNDFLRNVVTLYFKGTNTGTVITFKDEAIYTKEVIEKLKNIDIFITEAFNPFKIQDAEGFRASMKLLELGFSLKPLIIFRTIDKNLLKYPFILDYSTIYMIPKKIEELMTIENFDAAQFIPIIEAYPVLIKEPVHR